MKKKILWFALAVLSVTAVVKAMQPVYTTNLVNESSLAFSKNYKLDLDTGGVNGQSIDSLSFQATYSSVTLGAVTFTDGGVSTATISVATSAAALATLSSATATDSITVNNFTTALGAPATNQITIKATTSQILGAGATEQITIISTTGLTGTVVTLYGFAFTNGVDWFTFNSTTQTAQSLAADINLAVGSNLISTNVANVVFATVTVAGVYGNTYTAATSSPTLVSTSATSFSGGVNGALMGDEVNVNGTVYLFGRDFSGVTSTGVANSLATLLNGRIDMAAVAVSSVVFSTAEVNSVVINGSYGNSYTFASNDLTNISTASTNWSGGIDDQIRNAVLTVNGVKLRHGYEWLAQGASTQACVNIAAAISNVSGLIGTCSNVTISATATTNGSASNAIGIVSNSSFLSVTNPTLTGGQDNAVVTINGVALTQGKDWFTGTTSSATAQSISGAVVGNSTLNQIIKSTWSMITISSVGVVSATSTAVGVNAFTLTASPAALTVSNPTFVNGKASAYAINTGLINIPGHSLTTATQVLYTNGGNAITGLTNNTTFFVIPVDSNNIELATTSAFAQAGTPFATLTSSSTTGPHTQTLTPLTFSGAASFKWQACNDNLNFIDLSVASVTYSGVLASTSTVWDFGNPNFRYFQLNFSSPTAGGVNLKVLGNGKHSNP